MRHRLLELDVLRGIAVLLVVMLHTFPPAETFLPLYEKYLWWWQGGWVGVDIFFVLSGFLVAGLLFQEYQSRGEVDGVRFFIRRGFKIYPSLWVLMMISVGVRWLEQEPIAIERVINEILFLQNYRLAWWTHTWSLAVEEHFYIALTVWVLWDAWRHPRQRPLQAIRWLFPLVALCVLVARILYTLEVPFHIATHTKPTHFRVDALFLGVWMAYGWHFGALKKYAHHSQWRRVFAIVGILLLSMAWFPYPVVLIPLWRYAIGYTLYAIGAGCLLLVALGSDWSRCAPARWLGAIGVRSYSIYLWHFAVALVFWRMSERLPGDLGVWALLVIGYWSVALIVGYLAHRWVESPFIRLREQWFPRLAKVRVT